MVDDLVQGEQREVEGHHLGDGAHAGEGRAHRDAGDGLLRDRRVAHPPLAELGQQPLRDLVRALVRAHLLAEDEHAGVADHLFLEGLVQGLAHGEDGHVYFPTFWARGRPDEVARGIHRRVAARGRGGGTATIDVGLAARGRARCPRRDLFADAGCRRRGGSAFGRGRLGRGLRRGGGRGDLGLGLLPRGVVEGREHLGHPILAHRRLPRGILLRGLLVDVRRADVDVLVERLRRGVGALLDVGDRVVHLREDLLVHLVEVLLGEALLLDEPLPPHQDGVGLHHLLDLLLPAVLAGIGHGVAAVAVGLGFDEGRPLLLAREVDRLREHGAHGHEVHAVHVAAGDAVRGAALVEVLHRGRAVERRAHAVAVVLDDVDDGQVPQRAHVQGLVEGPFVHGAVAEEAEDHLVGLAQADAVAHSGGDGEMAAHDAVPSEVAPGDVVEVHAPALGAADPADLAAQLGEQGPGVGAAGEGVPVVAVGGDDVVVGAQQAHRAHAHRFLPDVEVEEAADLPFHVELRAALLETADEQHLLVQREGFVPVHGRLKLSILR